MLYVEVEIKVFMSTSMFNHIHACLLATMVAKTSSIVIGGSLNNTNQLIT
jgi:hypothetical protein